LLFQQILQGTWICYLPPTCTTHNFQQNIAENCLPLTLTASQNCCSFEEAHPPHLLQCIGEKVQSTYLIGLLQPNQSTMLTNVFGFT
jgi:hypothetical protein